MDEKIREIGDYIFWYEREIDQNLSPTLAGKIYLDHAKHLLSRIKELEKRQKWIGEVARPDHPDDERPWCAAYLDCRERIKKLEERIQLAEATREDALAYAKMYKEKIKELEEGIERLKEVYNASRICPFEKCHEIDRIEKEKP